MADSEEWFVVGGKGRPRRTLEQQRKHIQARTAAAAALAAVKHPGSHSRTHLQHKPLQQCVEQLHSVECADSDNELQVPELPAGSSPAQYAAQQQLAVLAAAMAKAFPAQEQQLPGWGPAPEREWKTAASSRSKRKGQKSNMPKTLQEQVEALAQQVQDISRELQQTPMFASLQSAMQYIGSVTADSCCQQHTSKCSSQDDGCLQQTPQQHQPEQVQHTQHPDTGSDCHFDHCTNSNSSSWCWQRVQRLVVYGLGSPECSKVSKHQLALVLLLQQLLPALQEPPQLYDPAFSNVDQLLLQQLGLQVINSNEECRRQVQEPTLFYLPHLEGALCDNLLDANWSVACLSQLAILGNSFTTYDVRWSAPEGCRPKTRRPAKLLQLLHEGAVSEVPVPDDDFHVASAFNDTSLHVFRPAAVAGLRAQDAQTSSGHVMPACNPGGC